MRKSRAFFLAAFLGAAGLIAAVLSTSLWAEELDAPPVTQTQMREALDKIEAHLAVIEENQKKILEGQDRLSAEHKQLRYWVHKK